jgi:hypothetical protein
MSFSFPNFRNFAPKFQAISERITATVADLNLEHNNKYPTITFSAVDCVEHRKLCEKYEIQAYPTVLPFNFPTMKSKLFLTTNSCTFRFTFYLFLDRPIRITGVEDEIVKFLKTFIFSVSCNCPK